LIKRLLFLFAACILFGAISFSLLFVYFNTRSELSVELFRAGYSLARSKRAFLHFYSPRRRDVSAGYLPKPIDEFLCERLERTGDPEEFDAIVHLYSLQAGGREGECVYAASDPVRQRIGSSIVEHFDADKLILYRQLVLLEEIRLGRSLEKGRVVPRSDPWPQTELEWKKWLEETALPLAELKYRAWWQADSLWNEKKEQEPLQGTNIGIVACCG
jgi:hypothetical protein